MFFDRNLQHRYPRSSVATPTPEGRRPGPAPVNACLESLIPAKNPTVGVAGNIPTVNDTTVLVATDAEYVHDAIEAALGGDHEVVRVHAGAEVLDAVAIHEPALVILDLQIGNMGGMAACLDLRLEERAGRIGPQRILMLLDRDADDFLARKAEADTWIVKPIDALTLRHTAREALAISYS